MELSLLKEYVVKNLEQNLSYHYIYKKTIHTLVFDEKDRVLTLSIPFSCFRPSHVILEVGACIKFKEIEKECNKYSKIKSYCSVHSNPKLLGFSSNFYSFYDETQMISQTSKLLECTKAIEKNFFDVYKEPKDVKDLFLVPYKDASPITMKPDNFLYKRLVFCKMFGEPIKEEYIDEGREFFIKNRPHRPDDLKNFEEFCSKIKTSMSSK